jgi:hypothetical protein
LENGIYRREFTKVEQHGRAGVAEVHVSEI